MKKLSNFEKKHILLGLLLMCGSIIFYVICTKGIGSVSAFRIFFPVFWGLYTIVSIVYIIMTSWLKKGEDIEITEEDRSKEVLKRRFLLILNIATAITMVIGYLSSTVKNASIQYATYQPLAWTLAMCVEIFMYVVYLFREEKPEVIEEPEVVKSEGIQIVSYEEAMRILEEHGYEIESKEDDGEKADKDEVIEAQEVKEKPEEPTDEDKLKEKPGTEGIEEKQTLPAVQQTGTPAMGMKKSKHKRTYKKRS